MSPYMDHKENEVSGDYRFGTRPKRRKPDTLAKRALRFVLLVLVLCGILALTFKVDVLYTAWRVERVLEEIEAREVTP